MRIGEILVERGHVTRDQVDEALRQQVIYGGRLGTTLVQMGALELDALAECLGQQHHLASGLNKHFDAADPALQKRLSPELAGELLAVPLTEELPGVVAVAFADPPSPDATARVGRALDAEIVPVIAPELRIRYQLEAVYGIARPNRFLRVHQPDDDDDEADEREASGRERRRYVTPLSETGPAVSAGTLGKMALSQRAVRLDTTPSGDAAQLDYAASLEEATVGIRRATDRDRVVDLAVSCMRDGFGRLMGAGVFLLCRQDMATGWRGFSHAVGDDVVQTIAIPLGLPSVLRLSYQTGVLVCGKPPPAGRDIDVRFWTVLGCTSAPQECVVAPIKVHDRVVCLLYCHANDLGPIPDETNHAISELATAAGSAFMRLIRSAER